MMDLHVLTARGAVLVAQVINGRVIVPLAPPAPAAAPAQPAPPAPAAAPAQPAPGK
jgi:hypothetical protein